MDLVYRMKMQNALLPKIQKKIWIIHDICGVYYMLLLNPFNIKKVRILNTYLCCLE